MFEVWMSRSNTNISHFKRDDENAKAKNITEEYRNCYCPGLTVTTPKENPSRISFFLQRGSGSERERGILGGVFHLFYLTTRQTGFLPSTAFNDSIRELKRLL
jgi:hypothetical protein